MPIILKRRFEPQQWARSLTAIWPRSSSACDTTHKFPTMPSLTNGFGLKWGDVRLTEIKSIPVEAWLTRVPRSPQTRGHIRSMFHILFQCAMRWELTDRNPISLVRQSTLRKNIPRVLTPKEFKALLKELTGLTRRWFLSQAVWVCVR